MAPEHFHNPRGKRLDMPVSARHFRAKLKITFALLIAQMERDHAIGLVPRPAAPEKCPNPAIRQAGDNAERQQYPYELKGIYDQITDVVPSGRDTLIPSDGRLITDLGQQPFGIVRTRRTEDYSHKRTRPFGHRAGNPLEIHKTLTGDLGSGVRKDSQAQFPARGPETGHLRFRAHMKGGGRGRNAHIELLQAYRTGYIAL